MEANKCRLIYNRAAFAMLQQHFSVQPHVALSFLISVGVTIWPKSSATVGSGHC